MRLILPALLSSLALPALAETQIRHVTLSTAGLAMLEAEGVLDADGLRLALRRGDIDDFLKSLRVSDPAGGVPMLSMTGPGGLEDLFAGLPFAPEDVTDMHALLGAMTGAPVTAERGDTTLSGTIMGINTVPCASSVQTGCHALALRSATGGIGQIRLDARTALRFDDAQDRHALERALDALRTGSRALTLDVTLTSSESDPRDVSLAWLQPAPVWKTAWRAEETAEGLELTGWAVIENATGQDWDDVGLTLATGAVQALQAQLYDRQDTYRPISPRRAQDGMMLESAPADMAPDFAASAPMPVEMQEAESFSRYTLGQSISVQAGEMISLPFLQETLSDARVTLYRGGSGAAHPMIALEIENPLPLRLPAGIATLYEDARGHAGDAMIPELAPGARELVEFAQDTSMRVDESQRETQSLRQARIVDGVLVAEERLERRHTYRIEGAPEAERTLTLLHPRRPGWKMESTGGSDAFDATRFEISVPAGEIVSETITESRVTSRRVALLDLDLDGLAQWSARLQGDDLSDTVTALRDLRAKERDLARSLPRLATREADLIADQERLVNLIVQLGDDSAATAERRDRVDAIDADITALRAERTATEARIDAIQDELRAVLRAAG